MTQTKNPLAKIKFPQLKKKLQGGITNNAVKSRQNRRRKLSRKKAMLLAMAGLLLIVSAVLVKWLFFTEAAAVALTDFTTYGSLNRAIEGSGATVPLETQTVTLASEQAEILNVFVKEGDSVAAGDPLYEQDDSEIDDLILEYETEISSLKADLSDYYGQLEEAQTSQNNLNVTAPFSGRVSEITVAADDETTKGSKLAVITDDSVMLLTQYVSYAYQGMISEGDSAYVSVADQMLLLTGWVQDIEWTNYISGDGAKCFTVEIQVPNPGSLSEGMTASCYFTSYGQEIYPVATGELAYGNYKLLNAAASGTVEKVNVCDYQEVVAGQTLFVIDSDTYARQIETLQSTIENCQNQIADFEDKIGDAEESRSDYLVTADIAGTVMEVNVAPGTPNRFMMMQNAVTVYNLDTMTITVNIDELDVDYLSEGMAVNVSRTSAEVTREYEAEISYISFQATEADGLSTFPVTIDIHSEGALASGVSVSYSVSVGDTEESVLAPVAAIQSTSMGNCLFVKAAERPENAVDLSGEGDPEVPQGFYAVPVKVGSSNSVYIRILSGVAEAAEVFTRYQQTAPKGGDSTSEDLGEEEPAQGFPGGTMPEGGFPGGSSSGFPGGNSNGMPGNNSGGMPGGM